MEGKSEWTDLAICPIQDVFRPQKRRLHVGYTGVTLFQCVAAAEMPQLVTHLRENSEPDKNENKK